MVLNISLAIRKRALTPGSSTQSLKSRICALFAKLAPLLFIIYPIVQIFKNGSRIHRATFILPIALLAKSN
jgi:hypothetical protein